MKTLLKGKHCLGRIADEGTVVCHSSRTAKGLQSSNLCWQLTWLPEVYPETSWDHTCTVETNAVGTTCAAADGKGVWDKGCHQLDFFVHISPNTEESTEMQARRMAQSLRVLFENHGRAHIAGELYKDTRNPLQVWWEAREKLPESSWAYFNLALRASALSSTV